MADNRIEIPLKRRHTEYQTLAGGLIYLDGIKEMEVKLLAAIADRLTDIADDLEVMNNGKRT